MIGKTKDIGKPGVGLNRLGAAQGFMSFTNSGATSSQVFVGMDLDNYLSPTQISFLKSNAVQMIYSGFCDGFSGGFSSGTFDFLVRPQIDDDFETVVDSITVTSSNQHYQNNWQNVDGATFNRLESNNLLRLVMPIYSGAEDPYSWSFTLKFFAPDGFLVN